MPTINRIRAKWDAQAAPQLRAELERMQALLDAAEARAEAAERETYAWMSIADERTEELLQAFEDNGMQPGLTKQGHIVAVDRHD